MLSRYLARGSPEGHLPYPNVPSGSNLPFSAGRWRANTSDIERGDMAKRSANSTLADNSSSCHAPDGVNEPSRRWRSRLAETPNP
ncbi:hypothetical protein [Baaleninema sp.]|uniref:hypothetical protein n=1 Tax=Baaleninema sp. TaxID=3101197 RepID=UPI003CFC12EE